MDKDIFYNGSGCVDPTAGKAIGGIRMFNPGDIVSRINKIGDTGTCVILAAQERVYQLLYLTEEEKYAGAYRVECGSKGVKYTDPFRISWAYEDGMEYLITLTDQEFDALREAVAAAAGMYVDRPEDCKLADKPVEFVAGPDPRDQQLAELAQLYDQARIENARLLGQLDVYKAFAKA